MCGCLRCHLDGLSLQRYLFNVRHMRLGTLLGRPSHPLHPAPNGSMHGLQKQAEVAGRDLVQGLFVSLQSKERLVQGFQQCGFGRLLTLKKCGFRVLFESLRVSLCCLLTVPRASSEACRSAPYRMEGSVQAQLVRFKVIEDCRETGEETAAVLRGLL